MVNTIVKERMLSTLRVVNLDFLWRPFDCVS